MMKLQQLLLSNLSEIILYMAVPFYIVEVMDDIL